MRTEEQWIKYLEAELAPIEGDIEASHIVADEVLIEFLKEHGFSKLAEVYNAVTKWYS